MDSISSRKKAGCVRQENACLTMQDEHLIGDFDAMEYELATFRSQVEVHPTQIYVYIVVKIFNSVSCASSSFTKNEGSEKSVILDLVGGFFKTLKKQVVI